MLHNLYVKNLALIDEIEVEFTKGLNILTGETGAGKSIILGSVNLALGGKYSADIIRKGAEYGYVELTFFVENNELLLQLISDILDLSKIEAGTFDSRKTTSEDTGKGCRDWFGTCRTDRSRRLGSSGF